jgi:hypothetical protein
VTCYSAAIAKEGLDREEKGNTLLIIRDWSFCQSALAAVKRNDILANTET